MKRTPPVRNAICKLYGKDRYGSFKTETLTLQEPRTWARERTTFRRRCCLG